MRKYIVLFLLIILIFACENKVTEYVDSNSWKIDKRISGSYQSILNTKLSNNYLMFISSLGRGYIDILSDYGIFWTNIYYYYPNSKVHLNDNYSIGSNYNKDGIMIYSNTVANSNFSFKIDGINRTYLKPTYLDSTFSENIHILMTHNQKENIISNGNNKFVFFFHNFSNDNNSESGTYYCLVTFSPKYDPTQSTQNWCYIENYKIEKLSSCHLNLSYIYFYKDNFIGSLSGGNLPSFVLNQDGELSFSSLHYNPKTFFEYNDKIWTLSGNNLWNSIDGLNWDDTGYIVSNNAINYFEFEDKLCGYYLSTLYELDLENIEIYYLDNFGLDYHTITSINSSESEVFVSTLGGLYSRDKSDFFKNKSTSIQRGNNIILSISKK